MKPVLRYRREYPGVYPATLVPLMAVQIVSRTAAVLLYYCGL